MKILITNDDGIESEGMRIAVDFAEKLGEVTVVAPKYQQSGKSHTIEIHKSFECRRISYFDGAECFLVDSSPADCVRFGIKCLKRQYDLVISGINNGYNVGEDIMYSGTVGAIFEAAANGHRGIALSTDFDVFTSGKEHLGEVFDYLVTNRLFDFCPIYNINIPLDVRGIRITKQGGAYYKDNFIETSPCMFYQEGYAVYSQQDNEEIDTNSVVNNYISITPLSIMRTDIDAYETITGRSRRTVTL